MKNTYYQVNDRLTDLCDNLLEIVDINDSNPECTIYELKYLIENGHLSGGSVLVFGSQISAYEKCGKGVTK